MEGFLAPYSRHQGYLHSASVFLYSRRYYLSIHAERELETAVNRSWVPDKNTTADMQQPRGFNQAIRKMFTGKHVAHVENRIGPWLCRMGMGVAP